MVHCYDRNNLFYSGWLNRDDDFRNFAYGYLSWITEARVCFTFIRKKCAS